LIAQPLSNALKSLSNNTSFALLLFALRNRPFETEFFQRFENKTILDFEMKQGELTPTEGVQFDGVRSLFRVVCIKL
jgi:hypothetical protein